MSKLPILKQVKIQVIFQANTQAKIFLFNSSCRQKCCHLPNAVTRRIFRLPECRGKWREWAQFGYDVQIYAIPRMRRRVVSFTNIVWEGKGRGPRPRRKYFLRLKWFLNTSEPVCKVHDLSNENWPYKLISGLLTVSCDWEQVKNWH